MRIYNEGNLEEWSRKLQAKHGTNFRLYSDEKETVERWAFHLSKIYNIEPGIRGTVEDTLTNWSKIIGG